MSRAPETTAGAGTDRRLFLIAPPRFEPDTLTRDLDTALGAGKIAGFLFATANAGTAAAEPLRAVCRTHEVAFFVAEDLELALEIGADGLHLGSGETTRAARAALGEEERLLGVACGVSRHAAMTAGEAGADYVAFGAPERAVNRALLDVVEWWSGLFVLPCLALGRIDADTCPALIRAGADLIGVADAVWHHPEGPAAGVTALERAIAAA